MPDGMDTDQFLKVQQAEIERLLKENAELRAKLKQVTDELEAEIVGSYKANYGDPVHPAMQNRLERDLSTVREARATLEEVKDDQN